MTNQTTQPADLDLSHDDLLEPVTPTNTPAQPQQGVQDMSLESVDTADTDPEAGFNNAVNLYEQFFIDFQEKEDLRKETLDALKSVIAINADVDSFLTKLFTPPSEKEDQIKLVEDLEKFIGQTEQTHQSLPLELYSQLYSRKLITVEEVGDMRAVIERYDSLKIFANIYFISIVAKHPELAVGISLEEIQERANYALLSNVSEILRITLSEAYELVDQPHTEGLYIDVVQSNIDKLLNYFKVLLEIKPDLKGNPAFRNTVRVCETYWVTFAKEVENLLAKESDELLSLTFIVKEQFEAFGEVTYQENEEQTGE